MEPKQAANHWRYVYVLLVSYPDLFSKLFRLLSRNRYSHASIGLSDSGDTFYSYVTTGFRTEKPRVHQTYKHKEIPCELYRMEISDEVYAAAKAILNDHERQSHNTRYSVVGLILGVLRIGYIRKDCYFCSQFVSEMLKKARVLRLAKRSSLYLPDDFTRMDGLKLQFSGLLSELFRNTAESILMPI